MTHPPGDAYYSTIAGIITTLYVALAVELRLLQPREQQPQLPEPRRERTGVLIGVGLVLVSLLVGSFGIIACVQALQAGSTRWTEVVAQLGVTLMLALFVMTTTEVFFGLLAQTLPARLRQQRTSILIGLGVVLIAAGVTVTIVG